MPEGEREQSWRDQLPDDELAVADRLRGMSSAMQSGWLGVEIFRVRKEIRMVQAEFTTSLRETNKATSDAITSALRAANPPTVMRPGQAPPKDWTITASQRAFASGLGAAAMAGALVAGKLLHIL